MTILLNEKEIIECVKLEDKNILRIIEEAFISLSNDETIMPPILRLDIKDYNGEVDVKTAYIKKLENFAIKISPGFFNNPKIGLPTTSGLMILLNSKTGLLDAILLDNGYLTNIRTAIAGAISAKYLSNLNAKNVGIIGAGMQAKLQLQALLIVRNPSTIRIWSRNYEKVQKLIDKLSLNSKLEIINCKNLKELVENSEILITTTPSSKPIILNEWIKKGLHITAMGSDAEHKNELDPKIIKNCDLYVPDSQLQTSRLGELHHAIKNGYINKNTLFSDLGHVMQNKNKSRISKDQITVCDLTGTGVQDTAIARYAYKIALDKKFGKKLINL